MTVTSVQSPVEAEQRRESRALDTLIKVAGVVIAIVAAVLSGFLEIFLAPLRAGGVPLCVAILMAAVANYAIAWFAHTTVGRRWAVAPPWVIWTLLMLFAAGVRTTEGDYLIAGDNYVALVMILVGSLTFAVYAYRMILKPVAITKQ
jgi:hypothetical protein